MNVDGLILRYKRLKDDIKRFDNELFFVEDALLKHNIQHVSLLTLSPFSQVSLEPPIGLQDIQSNIKSFLEYKDGVIPTDVDVKTKQSTVTDANGIVTTYTRVEQLTNKEYAIDISPYFTKTTDGVINGSIEEVYIVDTNNVPLDPLMRPRDGIFPEQYIGYVSNDMLHIFPDYRNARYKVRLRLWLNDHNEDKYVLDRSTFIVTEAYINSSTYNATMGENVNVRRFFNTIVPTSDIGYRVVPRNIAINGSYIKVDVGDIWVEAYMISTDIAIFRLHIVAS